MITLHNGPGLEGRRIITKGMIEHILGVDVPKELAAIRTRDEAKYPRPTKQIRRTQLGTLDFAADGQ